MPAQLVSAQLVSAQTISAQTISAQKNDNRFYKNSFLNYRSSGRRLNLVRRWLIGCTLLVIGSASTFAAEPITDDVFIRDAFASAQTEISLSQLALQKSTNAGVKKFAKAIIKDHSAANDQLRTLAASRKLSVPTALSRDGQQQIENFKNIDTKGFDAAYREQIQQTHTSAIELFDQVAKNPRADAELRVFASKRLPLYKKHNQMIDKLNVAPVKIAQRKTAN
jgi:putative membrane protein